MDTHAPLSRQALDEDLQIIRATLAAITDDVRDVSHQAGQALEEAMTKLDHAQQVFARTRES